MHNSILKYLITFLCLILLGMGNVSALEKPVIHCLQVDNLGDVSISWTKPSDLGLDFINYQIFYSTDNIIFNPLITITDPNILTDAHNSAGADKQTIYYYVVVNTLSGSETSAIKNTIYVTATGTDKMIANVSWNPMSTYNTYNYDIFKSINNGAYSSSVSQLKTQINYFIPRCDVFLNFQIKLTDSLGCQSTSNISATTKTRDKISPDSILFDSITVLPSGKTSLSWIKSTDLDTKAYYIYINQDNANHKYDSIFGINSTNYLNIKSIPSIASENYLVAPYDTCGCVANLNTQLSTIHSKATLDACNASITLNWTTGGLYNVNKFIIYYFDDRKALTPQLLATVSGNTFTYTHTTLMRDTVYRYFIRAIDTINNKSASSNIDTIRAKFTLRPRYAYLNRVTVTPDNQIKLTCIYDDLSYITEIKILRATSKDGKFEKIASIIDNFTKTSVSYIDSKVDPQNFSYWYKFQIIDSCNLVAVESNIAKSILLYTRANGNLTNYVEWNDYEGWDNKVSYYNIYRTRDEMTTPMLVFATPFSADSNGVYSFIDSVQYYTEDTGHYCYYIEAIANLVNTKYIFNQLDTVYSNEVCFFQKSKFFMPNAFVPASTVVHRFYDYAGTYCEIANNVIRPYFVHDLLSSYKYIIYNRLTQIVFETSNPELAWNGNDKNGVPVEEGVYLYYCEFKDNKQQLIVKTGTITLLR